MEVRGKLWEIWRRPIIKSEGLTGIIIFLILVAGWELVLFGYPSSNFAIGLACCLFMLVPCSWIKCSVPPLWYFRQTCFAGLAIIHFIQAFR
jgi:hypothetical protein